MSLSRTFFYFLCLTVVRLHLRPYDFYFEKIGGESPENIAEIVLCSFFNKNILSRGYFIFIACNIMNISNDTAKSMFML